MVLGGGVIEGRKVFANILKAECDSHLTAGFVCNVRAGRNAASETRSRNCTRRGEYSVEP